MWSKDVDLHCVEHKKASDVIYRLKLERYNIRLFGFIQQKVKREGC